MANETFFAAYFGACSACIVATGSFYHCIQFAAYFDPAFGRHFTQALMPVKIVLFDPTKPTRTRLLSFVGLVITSLLILLGTCWPSYYTIAALLALPSPLMFAGLIFGPKMIARWPKLRFYLYFCAILSVLCYLFEWIWLTFIVTK
jgi:hypothetical protein